MPISQRRMIAVIEAGRAYQTALDRAFAEVHRQWQLVADQQKTAAEAIEQLALTITPIGYLGQNIRAIASVLDIEARHFEQTARDNDRRKLKARSIRQSTKRYQSHTSIYSGHLADEFREKQTIRQLQPSMTAPDSLIPSAGTAGLRDVTDAAAAFAYSSHMTPERQAQLDADAERIQQELERGDQIIAQTKNLIMPVPQTAEELQKLADDLAQQDQAEVAEPIGAYTDPDAPDFGPAADGELADLADE